MSNLQHLPPALGNFIKPYDLRRRLAIPGDKEHTIEFSIAHFIAIANTSIAKEGFFSVALSGGQTPKAIFEGLTSQENRHQINWKKCYIFWSDERAVEPISKDSNYHMAMEAGFKDLGIPPEQVFRMVAESNIEENALIYESQIKKHLPNGQFDLVMLGMGDDGHTASLFPWTDGLHSNNHLVVANYIPDKQTWRMTLTYNCINTAKEITIYVIGENKAEMIKKVLCGPYSPNELPVQGIGTPKHPATWILDRSAAKGLF